MEKEQLSCEARYYYYNIFIYLSFFLLYLFITIILIIAVDLKGFLMLICDLPLAICLIYCTYRYLYFKRLKPKFIQETMLGKVELGYFNRHAKFTVLMNIDGKQRWVDTLYVFGKFINPLEDYSNRKALVGYDEIHDIAIVLEVLE